MTEMPVCPVHNVPMTLEGHYDDGCVNGTQYWDDKYACPVEGCQESEWDSWFTPCDEDDTA